MVVESVSSFEDQLEHFIESGNFVWINNPFMKKDIDLILKNANDKRFRILKVVVFGNYESIQNFSDLYRPILGEGFKQSYSMTIGAELGVKRVQLDIETKNIEKVVQTWILIGKLRFSSVREVYYKDMTSYVYYIKDLKKALNYDFNASLKECGINRITNSPIFVILDDVSGKNMFNELKNYLQILSVHYKNNIYLVPSIDHSNNLEFAFQLFLFDTARFIKERKIEKSKYHTSPDEPIVKQPHHTVMDEESLSIEELPMDKKDEEKEKTFPKSTLGTLRIDMLRELERLKKLVRKDEYYTHASPVEPIIKQPHHTLDEALPMDIDEEKEKIFDKSTSTLRKNVLESQKKLHEDDELLHEDEEFDIMLASFKILLEENVPMAGFETQVDALMTEDETQVDIQVPTPDLKTKTKTDEKYKIISSILEQRLCCRMHGRMGDHYCNLCGKIIPKEYHPTHVSKEIGTSGKISILDEERKKDPEHGKLLVIENDSTAVVGRPRKDMICPKCQSIQEIEIWDIQTRSADEAPTRFFRCMNCDKNWREYD